MGPGIERGVAMKSGVGTAPQFYNFVCKLTACQRGVFLFSKGWGRGEGNFAISKVLGRVEPNFDFRSSIFEGVERGGAEFRRGGEEGMGSRGCGERA